VLACKASFAKPSTDTISYMQYKLISYIYQTTTAKKIPLSNNFFCHMGKDNITETIQTNNIDQIMLDMQTFHDFENSSSIFQKIIQKYKFNHCSFVYISCNKIKAFKAINDKIKEYKIVTISSCPGFVDNGGDIEIQYGRKNLELEINFDNIEEKEIRLNSSLINIINNKKEDFLYE
jgi:hypothetical protein